MNVNTTRFRNADNAVAVPGLKVPRAPSSSSDPALWQIDSVATRQAPQYHFLNAGNKLNFKDFNLK